MPAKDIIFEKRSLRAIAFVLLTVFVVAAGYDLHRRHDLIRKEVLDFDARVSINSATYSLNQHYQKASAILSLLESFSAKVANERDRNFVSNGLRKAIESSDEFIFAGIFDQDGFALANSGPAGNAHDIRNRSYFMHHAINSGAEPLVTFHLRSCFGDNALVFSKRLENSSRKFSGVIMVAMAPGKIALSMDHVSLRHANLLIDSLGRVIIAPDVPGLASVGSRLIDGEARDVIKKIDALSGEIGEIIPGLRGIYDIQQAGLPGENLYYVVSVIMPHHEFRPLFTYGIAVAVAAIALFAIYLWSYFLWLDRYKNEKNITRSMADSLGEMKLATWVLSFQEGFRWTSNPEIIYGDKVPNHPDEIFPEEIVKRFSAIIDKIHEGFSADIEINVDGLRIPIRIHAKNPGSHGQVVGIIRDLRDEIETENDLALAKSLMSGIQDGVLVTNQDLRILRLNRAAQRITGYAESELFGHVPGMLSAKILDREFYTTMWSAIDTYGTWEGHFWNRKKSGEIYLQKTRINRVTGNHGQVVGYVALFSEVSKTRHASLADAGMLYDGVARLLEKLKYEQRMFILIKVVLDGDQETALRAARRLSGILRSNDIVARLNDGTFYLLLSDESPEKNFATCHEEIICRIAQRISGKRQGETDDFSMVALGAVCVHDPNSSIESLLVAANAAAASAKRSGNSLINITHVRQGGQS